ncbi:MAG: hypothetical protein Q9221_005921 [Calogaya cf. arnoldii]
MDATFGATGRKHKSNGLNMPPTAPAASLEWPHGKPCHGFSERFQSTKSQAKIFHDNLTKAPALGPMVQIDRGSLNKFVDNVNWIFENLSATHSTHVHSQTNQPTQPAKANSPSQQDLFQSMEEIKRLEQEMDRKVAAVEAAMKPRENPVALAPATTSGQSIDKRTEAVRAPHRSRSNMTAFGAPGWSGNRNTPSADVTQAPVNSPRDLPIFGSFRPSSHSTANLSKKMQAGVVVSKANAGTVLSTKKPANGAESTLDATLANTTGRSTIEPNAHHQTVAPISATVVDSSNEEASESTERAKTDAKGVSTSNRTAEESTIRASESASANIAPEDVDEEGDHETNEEDDNETNEEDDDVTDEEDGDDQSSSGDEDAEMEETETSEQSDGSDASDTKHIEGIRSCGDPGAGDPAPSVEELPSGLFETRGIFHFLSTTTLSVTYDG